jgi:hypothetical protein
MWCYRDPEGDYIFWKTEKEMPYLRFKGFDKEFLQQQQTRLVEEFSCVADVPREIVKVELLNIAQISSTPRSLEIYMFPRTQEKHDAIAATLHTILSRYGYLNVHIFFVLLTPSLYYKEGLPLNNMNWL